MKKLLLLLSLFTFYAAAQAPLAPNATAATSINTTSFSANWDAVGTATGYRLDVATSPGFGLGTLVSGYNDLDVSNVTAYSVTGLSSGSDYYYRVRAYNLDGTSGDSNPISLITMPDVPTANFATAITYFGCTANWSNVTGADGYNLDISDDVTFNSNVTSYTGLNGSPENITGLNPGTQYYYRVAAYNASGTSDYSGTITFGTLPLADLSVLNTVDVATAKDRDVVTYTVTVTNDGPNGTDNVTVSAQLPRGTVFTSANATQGAYNSGTGEWAVGAMPDGSSQTLTIVAQVRYFDNAWDFRDYYNFNTFVKGNANVVGSFIGGKMAVGGDADMNVLDIGSLLNINATVEDVLIVGNTLNYSGGTVHNGNVVYGATGNLTSVNITNGTSSAGSPLNFLQHSAYLNALSTNLAGYSVNGTDVVSGSTLVLTGTDIYMNVFDVSGTDFGGADVVEFNIPKGSVAIVNIDGATVSFTGGFINTNGTIPNSVLFNFYEATSLDLTGSSLHGCFFAPFAYVDLTGTFVKGQVFANSLYSISSQNPFGFVGYVPLNRTLTLHAHVSASDVDDPDSNPGNGNAGEDDHAASSFVVNTTDPLGTAGNGTWSLSGTAPGDHPVLSLTRYDASTILAGTANGQIYEVDNLGVLNPDAVFSANMPASAQIWSLAVDGSTVYAGTNAGLHRTADGGTTWTTAIAGKDVRSVIVASNGTIFAGTFGFGVYKSTDGGLTFDTSNQNISGKVINALTEDPDNDAIIAGTFGTGVSITNNFGTSWYYGAIPQDFITCLDYSSDGVLYAGTHGDGVYRSYDNGNTFHKLPGLPDDIAYAVRIDGDNNIFVSFWMNGIYASSDLGDSWAYLGLGGYGVSALYPGANGSLIAGTQSGKFIVNNSPLLSAKDETVPAVYSLGQNYPNPFNPATTINYSIANPGFVSLKVYDILGREVAVLASEFKQAGKYTVNFKASNLPSGVYIYSLNSGDFSMTKKLVLTK